MTQENVFWKDKKLEELSPKEGESLCDGCGKCCLHKLQDEETDELLFTCVSCQYLDEESCKCSVYSTRNEYVPDCLNLTVEQLPTVAAWLPSTCAYRLLYEGHSLPDWHPLVCQDEKVIHIQHISVKGKVINENLVDESDWQDYLI